MHWTPKKYQELAVDHLYNREEALLFMGCGLGKTSVCLRTLEDLFLDETSRGVLVVAPIRVACMTWPNEIAKWDNFNWLRPINLREVNGIRRFEEAKCERDIYLINYEKLPNLSLKLRGMKEWPFDTVIWDELTMAKNHRSTRVNSVRKLFRDRLDRHWGLTGTPTPNSLMDLFAQSRLIDGGNALRPLIGQFRNLYCKGERYPNFTKWSIREGAERRIYNRLQGYALTLKTEDWTDLPEVIETDIYVTLDSIGRKYYDKLEKKLIIKINDQTVDVKSAAILVSKLLQIASGMVYDEHGRQVDIHKNKIDAIRKLKLTGNSIIVYNFKHESYRLMRLPNMTHFTSGPEQSICDEWNKGNIKNLLVHPSMISHGLNLQEGGQNIVWMSPSYNREHYEQLYRRLAREGQTERVTVYRIIAKNTIDGAVLEALTDKSNNQNALLQALKTYADR